MDAISASTDLEESATPDVDSEEVDVTVAKPHYLGGNVRSVQTMDVKREAIAENHIVGETTDVRDFVEAGGHVMEEGGVVPNALLVVVVPEKRESIGEVNGVDEINGVVVAD